MPVPPELLPAALQIVWPAAPELVSNVRFLLLQGHENTGNQQPPSAAVQRQALVTQGLPAMLQHMRYCITKLATEEGVRAVYSIIVPSTIQVHELPRVYML